jgi:hypothetical protein
MEYIGKHIKKRNLEKHKAEMRNGIIKEGLPTHQNWAKHRRRNDLGPASSPQHEGGAKVSQARCRRTRCAGAPPLAPLGPTLHRWCNQCP